MASTGSVTPTNLTTRPSAPSPISNGLQPGPGLRAITVAHCAFCREPLPIVQTGINAWLVGDRLFCNEFCAESALE